MPTFIAFLRAVNVGKRKYPMAELREALTDAGFAEVETHIQTGNVMFPTSLRSREEGDRSAGEGDARGPRVRGAGRADDPQELSELYDEACDFGDGKKLQGHYVSLLAEPPTKAGRRARGEIGGRRGGPGRHRAVHLMLTTRPYHEATTGNAEVERHLGVATTRNLTVITKLTEKWGS